MLRYWHTVRHLKPVQIYGRLWFRLHRPTPDLRAAPPRRAAQGKWQCCARAPSMAGANAFRFLNVERRIATVQDWNRAEWPKLWLYNAHYFDDLTADDAAARTAWHRALLARWVAENPPGSGNGWEPYPTSLRIVNWVKWALAGNALEGGLLHSLAVQARWLRGRLEHHLLGNHLWANAKALAFAGAFFEGDEAARWRGEGLALLRRELAEQVLPDGGHFERSPMYHAIVLEDVLDLLQLAERFPGAIDAADAAAWREAAARMLRWLRVMTHPDGEIALFNDAAFGIAPNLATLTTYARLLGVAADERALDAVTALPESGYVRLEAGPAVLIADVGPIGPDHLPGHAHADTLSFELSLYGRRLLVNGGTSTYEAGAERQRQRGTAAHSTVQVDGEDSSEVWAGFRVARRARPFGLSIERTEDGVRLECAHDGYRRLPGRVVHRRAWQLGRQGLAVTDSLDGGFGYAIARFHLHQIVNVAADGILGSAGEACARWQCTGGAAQVVPSTWHPQFGQAVDSRCLEVRFAGHELTTRFDWA